MWSAERDSDSPMVGSSVSSWGSLGGRSGMITPYHREGDERAPTGASDWHGWRLDGRVGYRSERIGERYDPVASSGTQFDRDALPGPRRLGRRQCDGPN